MHSGDEFNPRNRFVGLWLPDSLARYKGLSHGAKLLYSRLCWFINDRTGECSPDEEELGEGIGIGKRQVILYLKELQRHQLIKIRRRGLGLTNLYAFVWHPVFEDNPARRSARSAGYDTSDVQHPANPEVQHVASQGVQRMSPPSLLGFKSLERKGRRSEENEGQSVRKHKQPCPWCHGTKKVGEGVNRSACGGCGGRGYV